MGLSFPCKGIFRPFQEGVGQHTGRRVDPRVSSWSESNKCDPCPGSINLPDI